MFLVVCLDPAVVYSTKIGRKLPTQEKYQKLGE